MLIKNKNWAMLPSASKSIFPVIASHCDEKGNSFPGERTIAIISGKSDKKCREGIQGLIGFPNIKVERYVTNTGKNSKKFNITLPPEKKGRSFSFHKSILEGGNWRKLKPTAQALYPVMRCFAFFNQELYWEEEDDDDLCNYEFDVLYSLRKYDFCEAEKTVLEEYAGINYRSIKNAFQSLIKCGLIEEATIAKDPTWRVYIHPRWSFKRKYLNEQIMKSYTHLISLEKSTGN